MFARIGIRSRHMPDKGLAAETQPRCGSARPGTGYERAKPNAHCKYIMLFQK
jgi:hypothetical protein